MKMQLNAARRLVVTAAHAKDAGIILTRLKPILGNNFKTKEQNKIQQINWDTPDWKASLTLYLGDEGSIDFLIAGKAKKYPFSVLVSTEGGVVDFFKELKHELREYDHEIVDQPDEIKMIYKKLKDLK